MKPTARRRFGPLGASLALATTLSACREKPASYAPPPPPEVTVARPERRSTPETVEATGLVRAIEQVELRARVRGFVQRKHCESFRRVKQGDEIFTIDPRPFEAAVRQAEAQLESAKASHKLASTTKARLSEARNVNAASQQEVDRSEAELDVAASAIKIAEAQLSTAKLDLEWTSVRAPINGRLGEVRIDEGQLVGASEPTLLTTVIRDNQVYVDYDVTEVFVQQQRAKNANRRPGEDGRPAMVVRVGLVNEIGYPHQGQFFGADSGVNPSTGTIRIQALFDNPDGTLLPGYFVRVQAELGTIDAFTVPETAVLRDQRGPYVLVVNSKNIAERRDIRTGAVVDRQRIILDGLDGSEQVVINGLIRARPGSEVKPLPAAQTPAEGGRGS